MEMKYEVKTVFYRTTESSHDLARVLTKNGLLKKTAKTVNTHVTVCK